MWFWVPSAVCVSNNFFLQLSWRIATWDSLNFKWFFPKSKNKNFLRNYHKIYGIYKKCKRFFQKQRNIHFGNISYSCQHSRWQNSICHSDFQSHFACVISSNENQTVKGGVLLWWFWSIQSFGSQGLVFSTISPNPVPRFQQSARTNQLFFC